MTLYVPRRAGPRDGIARMTAMTDGNPISPSDLRHTHEELLERTRQIARRIVEDVNRVVHDHEHDTSLSSGRDRPTDSSSGWH